MKPQSHRLAILLVLFSCLMGTRCAHASNACPASVPSGITNCYYADYVSGIDTNSGADELHPWKHIPGMSGSGDSCTSKCAARTPVAGDGYILKGGVTWPYTAFPLLWTWNGKGSTTSPGCTGPGCIYIGIDVTWFSGRVNAVLPWKDYGGCPASGLTATISGGNGSGATAVPVMIGGQTNFDEGGYLVAYYQLTNAGSGYSSNPAVTVSGPGCNNVQAVADIHRAVFDLGNGAAVWNDAQMNLGLISGNKAAATIWDSLDIRNAAFNTNSAGDSPSVFKIIESPSVTATNLYIHNWYTTQAKATGGSDGSIALNLAYNSTVPSGLASNNWVGNGESAYTCTVSGPSNTVCGYGTLIQVQSGVGNPGAISNNHLWFGNWMARGCPSAVSGNDLWGTFASDNGGHTNMLYVGLCGSGSWTMSMYDNLIHDTDAGSGSFVTQGNGNTWYVFNNVSWKAYGGGVVFGIDTNFGAGPSVASVNFWNNTMYGPTGTHSCINAGGAGAPYLGSLNISLYNNQCITNQTAGHWFSMNTGTAQSINGVTNPANTTADSANTVMTAAVATTQGFTVAGALAPTQSYVSKLVLSGQSPSSCSGQLAALCQDINQVPRPAIGALWGPGAYFNNLGKPPVSPPAAIGATVKTQ
jgi:hypothetical protein